jgi:hypothetical protein
MRDHDFPPENYGVKRPNHSQVGYLKHPSNPAKRFLRSTDPQMTAEGIAVG